MFSKACCGRLNGFKRHQQNRGMTSLKNPHCRVQRKSPQKDQTRVFVITRRKMIASKGKRNVGNLILLQKTLYVLMKERHQLELFERFSTVPCC